MILKYAFKREMTADQLIEKLSSSSINDVYDLAAQGERLDPFERYAEDENQRFARAKQQLLDAPGNSSLPTGAFNSSMPMPSSKTGFVPAMIQVESTGFKLVKLYTDVPDKRVMEDIVALVPEEAKLARPLLTKEPAYALFVVFDIYQRFLSKFASIEDWQRAAVVNKRPVIHENSTDDEVTNYMEWWRTNRIPLTSDTDDQMDAEGEGNAVQMAKRFIQLDALRFTQTHQGWHGTSITTQPFNPSCEFQLDRPVGRVLFGDPISVPSRIAARFVDKFPHETPWKLVRKAKSLALVSHNNKHVLPASNVEGVVTWRSLDPKLETLGSYDLTKPMLEDLHLWKTEFAKLKLHGRNAFHRYQLLCVEGDELQLALPDRNNHRRALGRLTSQKQAEIPEGLRFVDFQMIRKLIQLTMDYGVTYGIELLAGHQGLTALKCHIQGLPMTASVTLPLMLTQKGNPVEINFP